MNTSSYRSICRIYIYNLSIYTYLYIPVPIGTIPGGERCDSRAAVSPDGAFRQAARRLPGGRPALGGSAAPRPATARLDPSVREEHWSVRKAAVPSGTPHTGRAANAALDRCLECFNSFFTLNEKRCFSFECLRLSHLLGEGRELTSSGLGSEQLKCWTVLAAHYCRIMALPEDDGTGEDTEVESLRFPRRPGACGSYQHCKKGKVRDWSGCTRWHKCGLGPVPCRNYVIIQWLVLCFYVLCLYISSNLVDAGESHYLLHFKKQSSYRMLHVMISHGNITIFFPLMLEVFFMNSKQI